MHCDDCGADSFQWLAVPHRCHAKFTRRQHNGREVVDILESHTVEEFEEGYLATGNQYYQYRSGLP